MSRCSVCKMFLHGVHLVTHWTVEDMIAEDVAPDPGDVIRRAPGRFADQPSRADRNRLRRLSEQVRRGSSLVSWTRRRDIGRLFHPWRLAVSSAASRTVVAAMIAAVQDVP